MRIVSLLPSATEIVCALGFENALVGRSHECDFPPAVTRLPSLTTPKFNPEGSSAEVNERVLTILRDALAVYRVDANQLRDLQPDVIVTQSQCDVCAVSMRDVEDAVAQWTGTRPTIVSLAPYALADIFTDIERVATALGVAKRGREVTQHLRSRMDGIAKQAHTITTRPRLAIVEWIDPLMAAGNWMPELVAMAGGQNLFGRASEHSPWMKFDELAAADPEVILLCPCGFNMDRTLEELPALTRHPAWPQLQALRSHQIFIADGNQYFNRPGPRIAESLEILAEILHPEAFSFGHQGYGWRHV
ncbi:MAG TPA: cobalamin-binding protein [Candidatus Binataceae bacterium]|nr:cobalamin-binding protein [Candidatus Binataceae bacterium]